MEFEARLSAVRFADAGRYVAGVAVLIVLLGGCTLVLDEQLLVRVVWGTDCEKQTQLEPL